MFDPQDVLNALDFTPEVGESIRISLSYFDCNKHVGCTPEWEAEAEIGSRLHEPGVGYTAQEAWNHLLSNIRGAEDIQRRRRSRSSANRVGGAPKPYSEGS